MTLERDRVEVQNRVSFSKKTRLEVLLKTNGRCARCAIRLSDAFDVDHVIPRANGGSNGIENLQALCEPCHDGSKTPGDRKRIAKAKRSARKFGVDFDPDREKKPSRIQGRGFEKPTEKRSWPKRSFPKRPVD